MKKFTFMIDGYEDYEPSDYEYMYDEDRLWELSYDVIASSKEEAMKKLLKGDCTQQREIIDEDRVKILRIFGDPEDYSSDEYTEYTYLIVSTKDVRPGVDIVEDNITIIEKSYTENKWCSDGIERISTYLFSDGFSIKEINRGAPGWSESETLLINSNKNCFTLYTRGEDTYNSGDKKIYACQSSRFKAISKYENEKTLLKRKFEASLLNAKETSRETFLDREMPYLVA